MKGIRFIKEYRVGLANLTPLKIGNGNESMDLLIDKNTQLPIILGSSIAGAAKSYLIDLGYKKDVENLVGNETSEGVESESKIYIYDAYGDTLKIDSRTGIRRDYQFGTAKEKMKYDIDFIDLGTKFELGFKLFAKDEDELKKEENLINEIISGFKFANLRLGANKMAGFGSFEVNNVEARKYDLKDGKDLVSYILDNKKYEVIKLDEFKNKGNKGYVDFEFEGSVIDSMIIKDEFRVDLKKDDNSNIDIKKIDFFSLQNSKEEYIIPGTTIKGLFREYNTKILNTLEKDTSIIDDIYGTNPDVKDTKERVIGKVLTSDVVVKNYKECLYNRIKVDRFTGGVASTGVFNENRIQGDIKFKISLRKSDENNNLAIIGLILFTLRDLGLSKLTIGSSSSVGAGRIKGRSITIVDNGEKIKLDFSGNNITSNNDKYVKAAISAISKLKGVVL